MDEKKEKFVMSLFLLITYIAVLIVQIVCLVKAIKRKTKKHWIILFLTEMIPFFIATGLMYYYESLPGYGFMPGFSYLGEILASFGATILYGIIFVISCISCIVISKKRKMSHRKFVS